MTVSGAFRVRSETFLRTLLINGVRTDAVRITPLFETKSESNVAAHHAFQIILTRLTRPASLLAPTPEKSIYQSVSLQANPVNAPIAGR